MNQAQVDFLQTQGVDVPDDPVERELWRMGFDEVERARIIAVGKVPECLIGPIEIGEFLLAGRPLPFVTLGMVAAWQQGHGLTSVV